MKKKIKFGEDLIWRSKKKIKFGNFRPTLPWINFRDFANFWTFREN